MSRLRRRLGELLLAVYEAYRPPAGRPARITILTSKHRRPST